MDLLGREQKTVKVLVGIPNEGKTEPEAYHNRMWMASHLGVVQERSKKEPEVFEFSFHTSGGLLTPIAREKIVDAALKLGSDYVLMIDDDMIVQHDLFEKLYRWKVDVVAALAFSRKPPHLPVIYRQRSGYDAALKRHYYINEWVRSYPKGKLLEADAVGFGAVLIDCNVFKKMQAPYFMSTAGSGEDIGFCYRARKAGARIFMDTTFNIAHLGDRVLIDEQYSERFNPVDDMEKLYGAYERHRVFDVSHLPGEDPKKVLTEEEASKMEPEVVAGVDA